MDNNITVKVDDDIERTIQIDTSDNTLIDNIKVVKSPVIANGKGNNDLGFDLMVNRTKSVEKNPSPQQSPIKNDLKDDIKDDNDSLFSLNDDIKDTDFDNINFEQQRPVSRHSVRSRDSRRSKGSHKSHRSHRSRRSHNDYNNDYNNDYKRNNNYKNDPNPEKEMSYEEVQREKAKILYEFERVKQRGIPIPEVNNTMTLEELQFEFKPF